MGNEAKTAPTEVKGVAKSDIEAAPVNTETRSGETETADVVADAEEHLEMSAIQSLANRAVGELEALADAPRANTLADLRQLGKLITEAIETVTGQPEPVPAAADPVASAEEIVQNVDAQTITKLQIQNAHRQPSPKVAQLLERIRQETFDVQLLISTQIPDCRERQIALMRCDEMRMWACNAATMGGTIGFEPQVRKSALSL